MQPLTTTAYCGGNRPCESVSPTSAIRARSFKAASLLPATFAFRIGRCAHQSGHSITSAKQTSPPDVEVPKSPVIDCLRCCARGARARARVAAAPIGIITGTLLRLILCPGNRCFNPLAKAKSRRHGHQMILRTSCSKLSTWFNAIPSAPAASPRQTASSMRVCSCTTLSSPGISAGNRLIAT